MPVEPYFIEMIIVTLLGLVLGSFCTAIVYRIPRDIPWGVQRSSCPSCNTNLKAMDLFPIVSWALCGGKCRHCKAPVAARYPLVEFGVLLASLSTYGALGFTPEAFFVIAAVPFLVALLIIDLDHLILPNQLVFIVGGIGAVRLAFHVSSIGLGTDSLYIAGFYILGAAVFAGLSWFLGWFMTKILKRDSLGFGDVKFFAVAGLWLGAEQLATFFVMSGSLGIIFALIWQMIKKEKIFPFGPALITSLYALLLLEGSLLL